MPSAQTKLDRAIVERYDGQGMLRRVGELPDQLEQAWHMARDVDLPVRRDRIDGVVVAGMGGSAIAGDLVRLLAADHARVPVHLCREYDLPAFATEQTLVVASSYSGNTEETLSVVRQARERGCPIVGITTGGVLADELGDRKRDKGTLIRFDYPDNTQPRSALGYSFGLLLGVGVKLGLVPDQATGVDEAVSLMRELRNAYGIDADEPANRAKVIARFLHGRIPSIYGADVLYEVANRWKSQINENAKCWAGSEPLPELTHNAVVGYVEPPSLTRHVHVVLLDSDRYHQRVRWRLQVTTEILAQRRISYTVVPPVGKTQVGQAMTATMLGDFVSLYLAMLYGQDPTPVTPISFLKQRLASQH